MVLFSPTGKPPTWLERPVSDQGFNAAEVVRTGATSAARADQDHWGAQWNRCPASCPSLVASWESYRPHRPRRIQRGSSTFSAASLYSILIASDRVAAIPALVLSQRPPRSLRTARSYRRGQLDKLNGSICLDQARVAVFASVFHALYANGSIVF